MLAHLVEAAKHRGGKMGHSLDAGTAELTFGSRILLRVLGWLTPSRAMPYSATIIVRPHSGSQTVCEITIRLASNEGVYLANGFYGLRLRQFQRAYDKLIAVLRESAPPLDASRDGIC